MSLLGFKIDFKIDFKEETIERQPTEGTNNCGNGDRLFGLVHGQVDVRRGPHQKRHRQEVLNARWVFSKLQVHEEGQ